MKFRFVIIAVCCFFTLAVRADEGMWMLGNLDKQTRRTMKELGLQMPADKLYSSRRPSLKDAVVSFGGFCSGVVVSEDGLVFTNHHCGFSCVQQHSSVEHDYLKNGFVAQRGVAESGALCPFPVADGGCYKTGARRSETGDGRSGTLRCDRLGDVCR